MCQRRAVEYTGAQVSACACEREDALKIEILQELW